MAPLLILLLLVIAAVLWLRRPRPEHHPVPPSPYARDDAFGRPDPAWGAGMPPPQEGLGGSIARGVATGLAVGAGAALAQEFGRRAFEQGHDGQPGHPPETPAPHIDQSHSQLARDAGIGALDPASDPRDLADFGDPGWDDAGDDPGGWET
ncbi:hypothetical protein [Ramlibacter alkalitolerans]|uniref:Uncharacterized protein n=1 Tax=Ramlibacter alkalitolerans TaxID=2039631 RepID=A0ABS1JN90_9BURK|nr:hypothetical protein [Ramlibacter alkalitolerans]MBL0425734.1 hypothetical protein [Ramlibacter alkalitolerans]